MHRLRLGCGSGTKGRCTVSAHRRGNQGSWERRREFSACKFLLDKVHGDGEPISCKATVVVDIGEIPFPDTLVSNGCGVARHVEVRTTPVPGLHPVA